MARVEVAGRRWRRAFGGVGDGGGVAGAAHHDRGGGGRSGAPWAGGRWQRRRRRGRRRGRRRSGHEGDEGREAEARSSRLQHSAAALGGADGLRDRRSLAGACTDRVGPCPGARCLPSAARDTAAPCSCRTRWPLSRGEAQSTACPPPPPGAKLTICGGVAASALPLVASWPLPPAARAVRNWWGREIGASGEAASMVGIM